MAKIPTSVQSMFRENIVSRDSACLLSETANIRCQASHLVPKSRRDVSDTLRSADLVTRLIYYYQVYQTLLGEDDEVYPYETSMGILLRNDLHKSYNRYDWSLYCKVCMRGGPNCDGVDEPSFRMVSTLFMCLRTEILSTDTTAKHCVPTLLAAKDQKKTCRTLFYAHGIINSAV